VHWQQLVLLQLLLVPPVLERHLLFPQLLQLQLQHLLPLQLHPRLPPLLVLLSPLLLSLPLQLAGLDRRPHAVDGQLSCSSACSSLCSSCSGVCSTGRRLCWVCWCCSALRLGHQLLLDYVRQLSN
jgi:hypothetical protein